MYHMCIHGDITISPYQSWLRSSLNEELLYFHVKHIYGELWNGIKTQLFDVVVSAFNIRLVGPDTILRSQGDVESKFPLLTLIHTGRGWGYD